MNIKNLKLRNYRNYDELDIELSPGLNIFIGDNAQGKSNILESIFVLALTKSYMNVKEQNLIKDEKDYSLVKSLVDFGNIENNFEVSFTSTSKKIKIDKNEIRKYSDYVSRMKVLIFSPYNVNFVKDGPNVRRKSINIDISQLSNEYVKLLQNYNVVLKKRNQFLKTVKYIDDVNKVYFDNLNDRFCNLAVEIILKRNEFVININKYLGDIYKEITGFGDLVFNYADNIYVNDLDILRDKFKKKLESMFDREKMYGMTLIGPHRDDFSFLLDGKDLSVYGSQGQIRAAILALKLAEVFLFKEKHGDYPILLLDDIFSELDVEKRNRLVKYIIDDVQTIITTTDIHMIDECLVEKAKVFTVCGGKIVDDGKKDARDE